MRLFGAGLEAGSTVRALQQFVGEGGGDHAAILAAHRRLVEETLGEDDAVLIIDGSDFSRQGTPSTRVARQWCGNSEKNVNCRAVVFPGYTSRHGYTVLDRRLYLPDQWFTPEFREHWPAVRIPDALPFRTKPGPAAELVEAAMAQGDLCAYWVVGDNPACTIGWPGPGSGISPTSPPIPRSGPWSSPTGRRRGTARKLRPRRESRRAKGPLLNASSFCRTAHRKVSWMRTRRRSPPVTGGVIGCLKGARDRWWPTSRRCARAVRAKLPGPEV